MTREQKLELVSWMLLMLCVALLLIILTPHAARTVPCKYSKVTGFSKAVYEAECRLPFQVVV